MSTLHLLPSMSPRKGDITFEEFVDLIEDGQKADLLDGVIYMASPDNTDAAKLNVWLTNLMGAYVEYLELGAVYASRVAYRLGKRHGPEPDVGFVRKELESMRRRGYIDGPPRLAVEIVSPDSVQRDYIDKRATYEKAGVEEYWILDPDESRATFLVLRDGKYVEADVKRDVYSSAAIPGFQIKVSWLWSAKRPKVFDVLMQLLGKTKQARRKKRKPNDPIG